MGACEKGQGKVGEDVAKGLTGIDLVSIHYLHPGFVRKKILVLLQ